MSLVQYWISFEPDDQELIRTYSLGLGAGVTAFDERDALHLLKTSLQTDDLPRVAEFHAGITYDELEENHVRRNMGAMAIRGVWYPNFGLRDTVGDEQ